MKRFFAALGAMVAATATVGAIFGDGLLAQTRQDDSRRTVSSLRPPAKSPPARSGRSSGPVQTPTMKEWRPSVVPYPVYPYGTYPYGSYLPGYGYGYVYPYSSYPYYLPPVYLPAERLYGPEAMKRFLGLDGAGRSSAGWGGGSTAAADGMAREPRPASQRGTNRESLALAGKFIGYGDNHFAAQRYNDANQRYKKAAEIAPGVAEAYFRQGFAQAAMGRYEAAVSAIKRGLDLDPAWARSGFRIDKLYRNKEAVKKAHLDALAKAASEESLNPDLLFLLGVLLYFDGQTDRAAPFFQRADQLAGSPYLKGFLEQVKAKE